MLILFPNKYIARTDINRFLENRVEEDVLSIPRSHNIKKNKEIEILNIKGTPRGLPMLAWAQEAQAWPPWCAAVHGGGGRKERKR